MRVVDMLKNIDSLADIYAHPSSSQNPFQARLRNARYYTRVSVLWGARIPLRGVDRLGRIVLIPVHAKERLSTSGLSARVSNPA